MAGTFIRLAVAELIFLIAFGLFFADMADSGILVAALAVSVILVWVFVAPNGRTVLMLQDQLERVGGQGDVATELAQNRPTARPPQ